ncbi:DEAD/DEAH box helicase [Paenibacillus hamazuiensis]|uniref:DEAD/DEAH box helicase n=1 Tax=Paenibacillus hamazuiensis TaxID=2936508 RepID=UPI00200CCF12|nr:DEAD/DEAH box helicase [Paenibacillus hamazuiensis]
MSFTLTHKVIKSLCGQTSFERGRDYVSAKKVVFSRQDDETSQYDAAVEGKETYRVAVRIDDLGGVHAACSCPALPTYAKFCGHIAAVLLSIHDSRRGGQPPLRSYASSLRSPEEAGQPLLSPARPADDASGISPEDRRLASGMLGLFGALRQHPAGARSFAETRSVLDVEFTLKPYACGPGYGRMMFAVELKVGPKRLYIVPGVKQFLERIDRREPFFFSSHFTYNPELHCFRQQDEAILQELIRIHRNEKLYRETPNAVPAYSGGVRNDRILLIPPFAWENISSLLAETPAAKLEHNGRIFEGIRWSDEPLPLHFALDASDSGGYLLGVHGLDSIAVLEEYGVALAEGTLKKLHPEEGRRLAELKRMLEASRRDEVRIPPEQIGPFVEKVVPGLMKLGQVRMADAVSGRLVQIPLKARLYLDRVKDRLLAGLEFQYGDIVINPLEEAGQRRGEDRILVRDGERERAILELMEMSPFAKTEAGYFLDDEDGEYEFLYHVVPQLEKLVQIYATSAVKERIYIGRTPAQVSVNVDERTDWLEFKFDIDGIPESQIRNLLKSLEEKRRYYKLPGGALMPLESAEFQEIVRFLNEVGIRHGDVKDAELRIPVVRGMALLDSEKPGDAVKLGKSFRRLLENMRNPDNLDFPVPESLASTLRDYQKYGFEWLKTLAHYRFGGILADDMGLGKTVQSIAYLVSVLPEIRERGMPVLVVAPASLVYNWRNELSRFAPEIVPVIPDGSKAERSRMLKDLSDSGADVVITSYPLLRRDIELYAGRSFHTLILDEAQMFKNYATQTAQAVKSVQARHRFALTGTPVENRLEELWSIFDAVFPGLFPGRKAFGELSREAVARRARPFLLRRVKSDVLKELPEKIETLQASELLPEQKKLYVAYLAKLRQETVKHLDADTFDKNRIKILAGLTRLRQLCCHPALFVEGYAGSSAKFEQLLQIVDDCRSAGKRMLVFSQFTEMLGLIGKELGYRGVPFFYLDGQTPAEERVGLCSRFNAGERDLFLISLRAGGTGLNLTGADTVILYDLWWNPAVEEQAADRAHRIGQKSVVQVIRLVAKGTVEDKMYELQQRKKSLIEEVIRPGQESLSGLTEQEIREILMV